MKKCSDCNIEMIENCRIEGQHPFELGPDGKTRISIHIPTGEKRTFLGFEYNKENKIEPSVRICPSCGKVELYIDKDKLSN